ncbi:hypothetical protein [Nocardia acididurans]|nr:hypothetical protein [Nocardia acididurans]
MPGSSIGSLALGSALGSAALTLADVVTSIPANIVTMMGLGAH